MKTGESERPEPGQTLADQEPVEVPRSQVRVKTVATICAVVALAVGIVWLAVHSLVAITLTLVSALIAVALNHGVRRLQRWRVPRNVGVAIVFLALLGAMVGVVWMIAPAAVRQVRDVADRAPELVEKAKSTRAWQWANEHAGLEQRIQQMRQPNGQPSPQASAKSLGNPVLAALGGVVGGIAALVTILFLVVFMLLYGGRIISGVLGEALPKHRERYERVLGKIDQSVGGYLAGLSFIAVVNATLTSVFLAILKVPMFLPLGILSGIGSFLPLIGVTVSGALIALVTLAAVGPWGAIAAVAYITVYQQFENHVLTPLVYRRTVSLNPLVTLLGIVFMAELAGVVGAFLAVPLVSAAQIVVKELLLLRREQLGLPLKGDVARIARWPFLRRHRHA